MQLETQPPRQRVRLLALRPLQQQGWQRQQRYLLANQTVRRNLQAMLQQWKQIKARLLRKRWQLELLPPTRLMQAHRMLRLGLLARKRLI